MFAPIIFCVLLLGILARAELPDYIETCKRDNADVSGCIIKSVETLRPKLIEGIPELNVPQIEPLKLDDMVITSGLNLNVSDIIINGAGKFIIKQLKAELDKNRFAVLLEIPELDLRGHHSIDMKLLSIPLKGKGLFTARLTHFEVAVTLIGKVITTDGVNHLKFDPFNVQIGYGGEKELTIDGLFEDNPTLKQAGQDVIQDNLEIFLEELKPAIETSLSNTLTRIANQITTHFPYEELFPQ